MNNPNHLPPTAELHELAAKEQLFQEIAEQPRIETLSVGHQPTVHDIEKPLTDAHPENERDGVDQGLHAIVRAGSELFGVVKVNAIDFHDPNQKTTQKMVLTRFGKEGERATVVGVLDSGYPLDIGRDHQDGLSSDTSHDHFRIGINETGKLVLEDLGSTNGTELLVGRDVDKEVAHPQPEGRFGFRALKRAVQRREGEGVQLPAADPLKEFNRWAPKSYDMKIEALSPRMGIYVDRPRENPHSDKAEVPAHVDRMKKYEQEPNESVEAMANQADEIQEAMHAAIVGIHRSNKDELPLNEHDFLNLFASSDFISRSILASLRDARFTGVVTDSEVTKALQYAFDLPILDANTAPHDMDWNNEEQIIAHAELIQSKLHSIERDRKLKDAAHFPWAVPDSVSKLSHAFATIAHAVARNSQAAPKFSMNYHKGNLQTPLHMAGLIQERVPKS